jgi:hypothetical protein
MRVLLSSFIVLSLAACGHGSEPLAVKATAAKPGSLSDLELATAQLRQQHEAMSETLTWMEGEVMAMKAGGSLKDATHQPSMTSAAPAEDKAEVVPTSTAAQDIRAADAAKEPTKLAPETAPAEKVEQPAEEAPKPAEVSGLSDEDLKVQESAAPMVHLASYQDKKQVMPGWEKLKTQHSKLLEGLSPTTREYTDDKGKLWYRLYAGPFASAAEASERCKAIKGDGGWCE